MPSRCLLRFVRVLLVGPLALLCASLRVWGAPVIWISSTAEQPWQSMPAPSLSPGSSYAPPQVRVAPRKTYQTIEGFGGCFNELGWVALGKASPADGAQVLSALFADDGCAFTLGRIPVGASDFALDGYSLDDTPGDLELKNFSIARDQKRLIPFIKAAKAVRPSLRCWGSPWSPPAWMKTNNSYSKGSIKWEPSILRSYATYLARWVEAYRKEGVAVYALAPQNESNILSAYPSCLWTGEELREFIADYLGPTLRDRKTDVELWLGTLNGDAFNGGENVNDRLVTVLEDPKANAFLSGVTFQYDNTNNLTGAARELYPDKKLIQSETDCYSGKNSWDDAQGLFAHLKRYLENGVGSYFAWNLVLDESGMSTWKWRQNALITVDQATGKATYNGEYYVMRHFSRYVKPGAKRVLTTGPWGDKVAFVNPDGSTVIVIGNSDKRPQPLIVSVAGRSAADTLKAVLPARSINTFVVTP